MGAGKLSRRLFLLTLAALISVALVLFYNLNSMREERRSDAHANALRTGQLASLEMQRIISGAESVLSAMSAAPVVQRQDAEGCFIYLSRAARHLPQFDIVVVVDLHGIIVCSQEKAALGVSLAGQAHVKKAIETGKFVVGDYTLRRVTNLPMLPLALPFSNDDGKMSGVIIGALSLDWLGQRLRERDFARNSALTVADSSGTILAREPSSKRFVGTRIPDVFLRFVKADSPGTEEITSQDGTRRIIGYYPPSVSPTGLYVSAGLSSADAYASIVSATWIGAIVSILSLVFSVALAWLTSRELIQRPVERLVDAIRAWRAGDEAARTGMKDSGSELGVVGKAIDDLLSELVSARRSRAVAEQQRQMLVGELDHRVKNLLTTVQSVARQTFRDNSDPEMLVEVFNQRLTAMSEAHALLMKEDWQTASIRDVVAAATRPFDNNEVSQFEITGEDFPLRAKAVMSISMALHELCTNAVKYGALKTSEGRIAIDWRIYAVDAGGRESLRFVWAERNGPPVVKPDKLGFGSKMIERLLSYELDARVEIGFPETGITCTLVAPIGRVRADREPRETVTAGAPAIAGE